MWVDLFTGVAVFLNHFSNNKITGVAVVVVIIIIIGGGSGVFIT